ncbi:MAG TPA: 3-oxoacyl-[acyl-carrier-protein] synthase III C-terminal domain-containing protein [Geminicoccaceae bacterium]|nr:3-oxoacyl-[acyl-carrier-protein] synthase III C-terminal domain-containing protein [Geminicoccaceae bacterium]
MADHAAGAPRLLGVATALPPYRYGQAEAKAGAARLFEGAFSDLERLLPLFDRTGIDSRWSCVPLDWYEAPHGFGERNRLYLEHAEALLLEAARAALDRAGLTPAEVDGVVTVSSTGIATPSLEARLADRLGLAPTVERTPLFGLGCAGGVLGLSRAAALARARPGARVLLLVVELCALTLRHADRSKANLVACALFGDGAAAAVVSTAGEGPRLGASGEHRWPDTLDVMGWTLADDGLGVLFSIEVPNVIRAGLPAAAGAFLAGAGLAPADVDRWICHPGGAKVLVALAEGLGLDDGGLASAREVLRECGNMSAPTVLFVLERELRRGDWRRGAMVAVGPGFSAGFLLVEADGG